MKLQRPLPLLLTPAVLVFLLTGCAFAESTPIARISPLAGRQTPTRTRPLPTAAALPSDTPAAAATAALTPTLLPPAASPSAPLAVVKSRIAFSSQRGGKLAIYTMNADGSDVVAVTDGKEDSTNPAWQPGGDLLSFAVFTNEGAGGVASAKIYIASADASSRRKLLNGTGTSMNPAWSPDGRLLAYDANGIYVVSLDGTGARQLAYDPYILLKSPKWSPDASLILLWGEIRRTAPPDKGNAGERYIYSVSPRGGDLRRFVKGAFPAWAPDGKRVAYECEVEPGNRDICVINADGSGLARLTNTAGTDSEPDWSPDGTRILFTSQRDGNAEIYAMNPDGADQTRLTQSPGMDTSAAWQR